MSDQKTSLGPVMMDIAGTEATPEELELLRHPLVGSLILFSRNYSSPQQLDGLTAQIHALRDRPLLIAVDHEGGRVQRFREGFTRLPAMRVLGQLWDQDRADALAAARDVGYVLAAELRAQGVDLSFTPVLDLDFGASTVIGDRSFHRSSEAVAALAAALVDGLADAGMSAVGKHFPGHGFVTADSHVDMPRDPRNIMELAGKDLLPYKLMGQKLGGIMPAHVIYEQVDRQPAGFSSYWLKTVLRSELKYQGAIFSDDLSMAGAKSAGSILQRATAAWSAGCDVLLVCNDPAAARELLETWKPAARPESGRRLAGLLPTKPAPDLATDAHYATALARVRGLTAA